MSALPLKNLETALVYCVFLLIAFEDSTLQSTFLGYAGAGLAIFPMFALILIKAKNLIKIKEFIIYLAYSITVSSIMFLMYSEHSEKITIIQGSKAFLLHAILITTFFYFKTTTINVKKPLLVLLFVITCSLLASFLIPDYLNGTSFLHFGDTRNFRPRGFSLEASTYGFLCITTLLIWAWLYRIHMIAIIILSLMIAIFIQSKGSLVALGISACLSYFLQNNSNLAIKAGGVGLVIIAALLGYQSFLGLFATDIENYTSVSTRSTMAIDSALSILYSPIGHGFFGFLPYISETGNQAVNISKAISPFSLNYSEVYEYLVPGATENVGAKSFFFDSVICLGLPFAYFFIKYFKDSAISASKLRNSRKLVLCIFTFLSLIFFIPGIGNYISAVALGLVMNRRYSK